jgi:hypothetical protein
MPGRRPRPIRRTASAPPLAQFVLLSMLFHMLAILLFGAPSGGSREGRAMWGSLQVMLQGAAPEPPPSLKLDRALLRAPPKAPPTPGAESALAPPLAPPPPADVPDAFPRLLDRIVIPDLRLEKLPSLRVPSPSETYVPRPLPEPTPNPEPVAPVAITPPVERPPVETAVIPVPVTPPAERPAIEAPIVSVPPVEVPALPVLPTQSVTPPRIEAPSAAPEKSAPAEVPLAPAPPPAVERATPRVPDREVPREAQPERPMNAQPAPRELPLRTPSPSTVPRDSGEAAPSGTYDPTAAPPRVDLDAFRKRAGQIAREGSGNRALLPFPMPPPPERKTKEQIAIEKARKPDCRTAYKDLGLLAVAPLIANEFGEGTCRW